jgi:hypothetical protein
MYNGENIGCTVDRLQDGFLHLICNFCGEDLKTVESQRQAMFQMLTLHPAHCEEKHPGQGLP